MLDCQQVVLRVREHNVPALRDWHWLLMAAGIPMSASSEMQLAPTYYRLPGIQLCQDATAATRLRDASIEVVARGILQSKARVGLGKRRGGGGGGGGGRDCYWRTDCYNDEACWLLPANRLLMRRLP